MSSVNGNKSITTSIYLSGDLLVELDKHVNKTGSSRSELIEFLLRKVLKLSLDGTRNITNLYFKSFGIAKD